MMRSHTLTIDSQSTHATTSSTDLISYMLHYTRSTLPQQWGCVAQATCTKFNFYYTYVILNYLTHVASETLGRDIFHTYTLCAECLFRHVLYTEGHLLTLPISSLQLLMGESTSMGSPHLHLYVHAYTYRIHTSSCARPATEQEIL